jgi:hypothetical protein
MTVPPDELERRSRRIAASNICYGGGWICENHPDKSWPGECECRIGKPCVCSTNEDDIGTDYRPDTSKSFTDITAVQGKKVN